MAPMSPTPAADARDRLLVGEHEAVIYRLDAVSDRLAQLPFTVKVLLENVLRNSASGMATADDVAALAAWRPGADPGVEIPFMPGRVLLQDFTGVPAVVDFAAMRDAMDELGGDPALVNPLVPASLVIDHSVQIDRFGSVRRLRLQRGEGVRAQRRALPAAALGPDGAARLPRRAARHGHRAPGQPRVPR